MYDLYEIDENSKKFYNFYKDRINNIFNAIYEKINMPKILGNTLIDILYDELCKNGLIELKEFDLVCCLDWNYVILQNKKENIILRVIYLKKVKVQKIDTLEEFWICNDYIGMLICNQEKFIYYLYRKLALKSLDEERFKMVIISDPTDFHNAIMDNYVIHSSDTPYFLISDFKNKFNTNLGNKTMKDYLTGIDGYNFESILNPDRVKHLRGNIGLKEKMELNKNCFQFYLYNARIGLTLEILRLIDSSIAKNSNQKFLYLNLSIILNESSKVILEQYLAYYLTKLFSNYEDFKIFYEKIIAKISKKKYTRDRLIYKIVKFIIKNYESFGGNICFILDNIYNYENGFKFADTFREMEKKLKFNFKNNKIYFAFFVQLNRTNLALFKQKKKDYIFKFINNDKKINPDVYIRTLDTDYWYKRNLKEALVNDIELFLKNKTKTEKLTFLVRMKYFTFLLENDSNFEDIEEILWKFLEYLHLTCSDKDGLEITKIEYKNDLIKNIFSDEFNSSICDVVNSNDLKIFDILINNSVEGVLLEKQIILSLIASKFFNQIKINKIYCVSDFPDIEFNYGEKIIITQILDNSPIYDFGIIVFNENEIIFKAYQVGINKDVKSLLKLDEDVIQFDIEYFLKKFKKKYGININKYIFGIITTKGGYDKNIKNIKDKELNKINDNEINDIFYSINIDEEDEYEENLNKDYKNYKTMKQYCQKHNFEFIIFDRNNKESYLDEEDELISFNFIEDFKENCIRKIENIYDNCDINNLKKSIITKNEKFKEEEIKSIIKDYSKIKYIAKYQTKNKEIPKINKKNFYLGFYNSDNHFCLEDMDDKIFTTSELNRDYDHYKSDKYIGILITRESKDKLKTEK